MSTRLVTKYHPGERVVIRGDLVENDSYLMENGTGGIDFGGLMSKQLGRAVTINSIEQDMYKIKEDNGADFWTDEMIEGRII